MKRIKWNGMKTSARNRQGQAFALSQCWYLPISSCHLSSLFCHTFTSCILLAALTFTKFCKRHTVDTPHPVLANTQHSYCTVRKWQEQCWFLRTACIALHQQRWSSGYNGGTTGHLYAQIMLNVRDHVVHSLRSERLP